MNFHTEFQIVPKIMLSNHLFLVPVLLFKWQLTTGQAYKRLKTSFHLANDFYDGELRRGPVCYLTTD